MKKKILTTLSVVLILALAASGILAYLSNTDSDVNVMTLGNVDIEQIEQERGENGNLQEFTGKWPDDEKKPLYPAVYEGSSIPWAPESEWVVPGEAVWKVVEDNDNVIDSFVTVKNTGKSDAYVRTVFAIEVGDNEAASDYIHIVVNNNDAVAWEWVKDADGSDVIIDVDGATYQVASATYSAALAAGNETIPSLKQVYLDKKADNEEVASLGEDYRILVISQAVQTQGFGDAKTALDTAFGYVFANAYEWFNNIDTSDGIMVGAEKFLTLQEAVYYAVNEGVEEIEIIGQWSIDDNDSDGKAIIIPDNARLVIKGKNNAMISRTDGFTGTMFTVGKGAELTLESITVDGGAVWTGEVDGTLQRGTTNSGVAATGYLVATENNAKITLNDGAVLQNNDGAYAVNLGTRIGATLTLDGGKIINNRSGAGAIWGGGHITVNEGSVISGNSSTGLAGVIRMVSSSNFTMNGGEISNNKAAGDGGVIWGYGSSTYNFNGGKMSNNESARTGGAIYTGTYSVINISGDFEMCDNKAANSGAIRLTDHTSMNMTGGKVSGNTQNGESNAFNTWNNSISITGGELDDDMVFTGGLGLTIGAADIDGVISYNLSTNHNTAYLSADFNGFKFIVNEADEHFSNFNFKPAAGYTYTAGDEAKLVCLNEGYETYWDAATSTFRLKAK